MRHVLLILLLLVLFSAGLSAGNGGAATPAETLENLPYRISLGPRQEVARVALSLKAMGPGHYQAECSLANQGLWGLLRRWLPERYRTEMVYRQGRLQPLVFREEVVIKGARVTKEYRFDYESGRLEYWRRTEGKENQKRWQVSLQEPVYDPLTLVYNIRLGAFGPLAPGETLRVPGIPTPEPSEMILHIGPETDQGRKVMITVKETTSGKESDPYFIYFNPEWVPHLAWTRVWSFGKLMGSLLNPDGLRRLGPLGLSGSP